MTILLINVESFSSARDLAFAAPAASAFACCAVSVRSRTLKRRKKRCGFGGLRRGGENRLLVGFQDLQPVIEVLRVIDARLVGDPQIGAKERGAEFGDKLLHGVGVVAETLSELAIAARLMT